MKVLDLRCGNSHVFEGWFGSEADFQDQLARNLVSCPLCGNEHITKVLTAARLNLSGDRGPLHEVDDSKAAATPQVNAASNAVALNQVQAMTAEIVDSVTRSPEVRAEILKMVKEVMDKTEDVGNQFADEARRIHYGESRERGIRGHATHDQALELIDEGIDIMSFNVPDHLKGTLQ